MSVADIPATAIAYAPYCDIPTPCPNPEPVIVNDAGTPARGTAWGSAWAGGAAHARRAASRTTAADRDEDLTQGGTPDGTGRLSPQPALASAFFCFL